MGPKVALESLRAQIAQIEGRERRARSVLPFGIAEVDSRLPGNGLAVGTLHEIAGGGNGAVDGAAAALFAAGIAARTKGKVLWCITRPDLFAPALAQAGLAPDRVIYVEAGDDKTVLACMEEGLRHGGLGAVVAEVARLSMTASRRLQLAAEGTQSIGIALRRWRRQTETADFGAGEACPIIVVATSATDKSRTAKLLEKRKDALVAMFYAPDLMSVTKSVRALADAAGVRLGGDLAERIARAANLDVRLARSEVDKLALYLDAAPQSPQTATADDIDAIGAASEDDGFAPLVNAVMGGQSAKVGAELARMKQLGLNPVGVLLAFERRAAQLARIAAALGSRPFGELDRGQEARLGIFFKEKRDIGQQFAIWRHGDRLDRLTQRLVGLHRELLTNSQAAELLLAQGLADIARVAGARTR